MSIIIHNKLINKCYFGTFGKHSVFGNGDVDAPSPHSMRCERLGAEGSVRSLYLWCDARLPNWADSVTRG